jgi:hypothetical protein
MTNRDFERAQAISFGIVRDADVPPWTMIEAGRYQPRRFKGSYRGRELG